MKAYKLFMLSQLIVGTVQLNSRPLADAEPRDIQLAGCTRRVDIEGGCLFLSADDGLAYLLLTNKPWPDESKEISVSGKTDEGINTCDIAGVDNIRVYNWKYTGRQC